MGEMYKTAMAQQKENEASAILREAAIAREEENRENAYFAREAMKEAVYVKRQRFYEYKDNVRKALLTESLKRIYVGSIKNPSSEEKAACEAFLGNFINERGVDNLLYNFEKSNTPFLETLNELIDKYHKVITEDADMEDPSSFTCDKEHIDNFIKELEDKEDVEDITDIIRMRVAGAEEDFVNRNERDKHDMKSILDDTARRVQDAKPELDNNYGTEDDDVTEEIQREQMLDAKRKISEINSKPRSVFDRMVRNLSESVLKDPELRDQFVGENGRLNMDKIVDSVRCMYTMLEMVSTLKIEKVDAKYIEDTIKSI